MEEDIETQLAIMESLRLDAEESSDFAGFDFETFEVIAEISNHLGRANTFFDLRQDWYKERYASRRLGVPLLHNNFQAKEDANAMEHATIVLDALKPARDAALQTLLWFDGQMRACQSHVRFLSARVGFLTFPDEVLSVVLEFASYQRDRDELKAIAGTVKAAVKLSHVCARFRRLLISASGLWNRVCPLMHVEAISTCLARCGRSGVDVCVSTTPDFDQVLRPSLGIMLPKIRNWRRFVHVCEDLYLKSFDQIHNLERLGTVTFSDTFPHLSDLAIHYPRSALDPSVLRFNQSKLHFYSTWSVPGLRSLTAENLIPISFSGTNNLVSFSAILDFRSQWQKLEEGFPIASFTSFLSSCPVLEALALKIEECRYFFEPEGEEQIEMLTVRSAKFCFSRCSSAVVKAFLGAVRLSNVEKMHLRCDSQSRPAHVLGNAYQPAILPLSPGMQCQQVLQEVFPNANMFPKLTQLELEIDTDSRIDPDARVAAGGNYERPVSIPFSNMPNLRELELRTGDTFIEHLPETVSLPPLRSLSIVRCRNMDLDWFVELYSRLSMRHTSDGLEKVPVVVTVRGCPWERQWRDMCGAASTWTIAREVDPANEERCDGREDEVQVEVNSITDDLSFISN